MKTSAEKSSTTTPSSIIQRSSTTPFFSKAGGGSFFAPAVQMKMPVSKPGDKHEQEADLMADKVMRMPSPGKEEKLQRAPDEKLQKKGEEKILKAAAPEEKVQKKEDNKLQKAEEKVQKKEEEKLQKAPVSKEKLQRKGSADATSVNANLQSAIQSRSGGGQPLSSDVRSYMESRFNADFSKVHIHIDPQAAALSNQIGAKAFTYRNNIFFSLNQYQPGTSEGKQLLAHELTHTIQQGHSVRRKAVSPVSTQKSQKAAPPASKKGTASSGVVDLSSNIFQPLQTVKDEIEAQGINGLDVRVKVKGLTGEGRVKIKSDNGKYYNSIGKGSMPLLNAWGDQIGGMHINFNVTNGEVTGGYASLTPGEGTVKEWLLAIKKNSSLLGGLGLNIGNLPTPINKFDNGKLTFGVTNLKVEVGGFVSTLFNISVENTNNPKIDGTGDINVKGVAKGQLKFDNTQEKLTGQVSLAVDYKSFSGAAEVTYNPDGTVDIAGKAAYNANKLSGEIQFVATDLISANSFAKDAISAAGGKENVQNAAAPAPVPAPKANQKQRALAATGQLAFNLTTWFAGTVNVVVDGKGEITVIGKIAPPAEVELFKQRDWVKQLVKFEAKAYYGIPLVGNLNLFANISLFALARLGPAKMYNIEILGTYSTDPNIQKNIQIAGSINILAYAGLRLRAEGGAGVEIVAHNVKFGIGLNADVGIKAYVDTRPTIGYRDPGVFYISGTLEMVAQPMLGLGGDFFIQLESPWWSPVPNEKWMWPLFSKEWPMADPIGLSATLKEYVLGSGVAPEIEMKKPEFDPSKFMTSMVDKTFPDKTGGPGAGQGRFKEEGSVSKPDVKSKNNAPKQVEGKPGKKGAPSKGGKSDKPDKNATLDQDANKTLKSSLEGLKNNAPYSKAELDKALGSIQGKVKGVTFNVQEQGDKWSVTPISGGKKKSGGKIEVGAKKQDGKNKNDERSEEKKKADKLAAIGEAEKLLSEKGFDEKVVREKLIPIKKRYKLSALELVVESKNEQTETVHFSASASSRVDGKSRNILFGANYSVHPHVAPPPAHNQQKGQSHHVPVKVMKIWFGETLEKAGEMAEKAENKEFATQLKNQSKICLENKTGNNLSAIWLPESDHVTVHGAKPQNLEVKVRVEYKTINPKTGKKDLASKPRVEHFNQAVKNPDIEKLSEIFLDVFNSMLTVGIESVKVLKLQGNWDSPLKEMAKKTWEPYIKVPSK